MKAPIIAVIDYGMGNLRSVGKALEKAGAKVSVTDAPSSILSASAVVFPGVGSFGPAISYVRRRKLDDAIAGVLEKGKPFLGLCLGFQLLFERSSEGGSFKGLGIIPGTVPKFDLSGKRGTGRKLPVPHMGWNTVKQQRTEDALRLFRGIPDNSYFYFVHSYYGKPGRSDVVAGMTTYGIDFCSAIAAGRTWACQFHPEKSGDIGLRLLKNFVREAQQ